MHQLNNSINFTLKSKYCSNQDNNIVKVSNYPCMQELTSHCILYGIASRVTNVIGKTKPRNYMAWKVIKHLITAG